ncbi:hypothetical protein ACFFRR_006315 [Megaselia abdita]
MEKVPSKFCEDCLRRDHSVEDCPLRVTCSNCYGQDHEEEKCKLPKQYRCSNCSRANTRTVECDCDLGLWKGMQTLRLVGPRDRGIPLVDVTIYSNKYVASFALNASDTFISPKVVEDYTVLNQHVANGLYNKAGTLIALELHIVIGNRLVAHPCYIADVNYDVVLGTDFLHRFGFGFRIGPFGVNNFSPTFSMADEIRYWVNLTSNAHEDAKPLVEVPKTPAPIRALDDCQKMTFSEWSSIMKRKMRETPNDPDVLNLYPSDSELDF